MRPSVLAHPAKRLRWSIAAATLAFLGPGSAAFAQVAGPPEIQVTVIVRDFKGRMEPGGHPDFERNKALKAGGLQQGAVAPALGADRKPVFIEQSPKLKGFTTAANFDQWYRDVLDVNLSTAITMILVRQADGTYVFDDKTDPTYSGLGGYFPIDGQLFGNSPANSSHNFHFTTEVHARFIYDAAGGQILRFTGDDDIWVFIAGELVIDLGGTHSPMDKVVDLSSLGLVHGQSYTLDLFHAERQTNGSNFRFQAHLLLEDAGVVPTITAAFD